MNATPMDATLVLVDDDEEDAMMLRAASTRGQHGAQILYFSTGEDLFTAIRGGHLPQRYVIMLDLNMPEMDGFSVLKRLRSEPGGALLPVVVYTTSSDSHQIDRAFAAGANSFLTKPSSLQETIGLISYLVTSWFVYGCLPRIIRQPTE